MSYDNDNKGAVWKNEKKTQDTHADWTGSATINGVEYWVNMWKRAPGANEKAPSIKFTVTAKERKETRNPVQKNQGPEFEDSEFPDFLR
jgi:hypothetical protein